MMLQSIMNEVNLGHVEAKVMKVYENGGSTVVMDGCFDASSRN